MFALRKLRNGPGHVQVVKLPKPEPGSGEVLLQIKRAGICGTDLHILQGTFSKTRPPVTMGHEMAGVVESVGAGVLTWGPGDRVTVESETSSCGSCRHCLQGLTNLCSQRKALGYSHDGGFASYTVVRQNALHKLPENISFREGALCEPLAVAVHAVFDIARLVAEEKVLIIGPGPIGLLVLQLAKLGQARTIMVGLSNDQERIRVSHQLGTDWSIIADRESTSNRVLEFTKGEGADVVIECSGSKSGLSTALSCVRSQGKIIQTGLFHDPIDVNMNDLVTREITLRGAFAHNHSTWKKAMKILAKEKINLELLISGEHLLNEWSQAFELVEKGTGIKFLLNPAMQYNS